MADDIDHARAFTDGVAAVTAAYEAQQALFALHRSGYDAFFSPPLSRHAEDVRARLDPAAAEAVRAIEAGSGSISAARSALPALRESCLVAKAAALGAAPRDPDLPDWAACLRDLAALRTWRRDSLDRIDVDMAPLFLRGRLGKGPKAQLFDRVVRSWAKAGSADADGVRERLVTLAAAGLAPSVDPAPASMDRGLEAMLAHPDADTLIEEVGAAYASPFEGVPVPEAETLAALRNGRSAPAP